MARVRGCKACSDLSKNLSGGVFLTLEDDGDEAEVAFVGYLKEGEDAEPEGQEQVWIDGGSEEYDPSNKKHKGLQPRAVFMWNVFVFSMNGSEVNEVKIWKQGAKFFRTWMKAKDRKGMNFRFVIERDGKSGSKRTEYRLDRENALTDDEIEDLKGLQLLSFDRDERDDDDDGESRRNRRSERRKAERPARKKRERSSASKTETKSSTKSNGETADAATLEKIREKLKGSADPKAALTRFTKEFGLDKVKDLPAAKVDEAMAFIAAAESSSKSDDGEAEVDPFE